MTALPTAPLRRWPLLWPLLLCRRLCLLRLYLRLLLSQPQLRGCRRRGTAGFAAAVVPDCQTSCRQAKHPMSCVQTFESVIA